MAKASLHKGKVSGQKGEAHMDRDFDFERVADHIDPSKTHLNVYRTFCAGDGSELSFYKMRYQESLDKQNARYLAKRNKSRCRDMEQVYENKKTRPTEEIIQYSQHGETEIPKEIYDEIVARYVKKVQIWSFEHGNHFHVLKYATHYDEGAAGMTHTHLRTIWDYEDENGVIRIGQEKGMEQAGLKIPDEKKFEEDIAKAEEHKLKAEEYVTEWDEKTDDDGNVIARKPKAYSDKKAYDSEMKKYRSEVDNARRYNNRLITWTDMTRKMWEDTLEEFGYACDRTRAPKARHLSRKEWDNKMNAIINELTKEREQMAKEKEQHLEQIAELNRTIEELKVQIDNNAERISQQLSQMNAIEKGKNIQSFDLSKYGNIRRFTEE